MTTEHVDDALSLGGAEVGGGRCRDEPSATSGNPTGGTRVLRGKEWDEAIMRALRMAAKDAHLRAYQTGTGVVTRRNGKVVVVAPDPAMYEDLIPPPFQEDDRP